MDGRCVYLCLSVFIINFLSVTNEGKKILIRDSLKIKPFDDRLGAKQLHLAVAKALTARYNNRKMLEVSKTRYKFHLAWRGIKNFFWKKLLGVFCPSITRELKAVRVLKDVLTHPGNDSLKDKFGFKLPFKKSQKKVKEESSEEESDGKSDEKSDEDSDEESDEESDEKRNSKSKKGKKSKNKDDSDEDDDDSESSEEDTKKKKAKNKSLDDLFK